MENGIYVVHYGNEKNYAGVVTALMSLDYEGKSAFIEYGYNGKEFKFYQSNMKNIHKDKGFIINQENLAFFSDYIYTHLKDGLAEANEILKMMAS